jgi:multicomponent K+:H+ antiporter subunit G
MAIPVLLAITLPFSTVLLARAALFRKRQDGANIPPPLSRG